jgi:hypothetical protein
VRAHEGRVGRGLAKTKKAWKALSAADATQGRVWSCYDAARRLRVCAGQQAVENISSAVWQQTDGWVGLSGARKGGLYVLSAPAAGL